MHSPLGARVGARLIQAFRTAVEGSPLSAAAAGHPLPILCLGADGGRVVHQLLQELIPRSAPAESATRYQIILTDPSHEVLDRYARHPQLAGWQQRQVLRLTRFASVAESVPGRSDLGNTPVDELSPRPRVLVLSGSADPAVLDHRIGEPCCPVLLLWPGFRQETIESMPAPPDKHVALHRWIDRHGGTLLPTEDEPVFVQAATFDLPSSSGLHLQAAYRDACAGPGPVDRWTLLTMHPPTLVLDYFVTLLRILHDDSEVIRAHGDRFAALARQADPALQRRLQRRLERVVERLFCQAPPDAEVLRATARLLFGMHQYRAAVVTLRAALGLCTGTHEARTWFNLALCQRALGDEPAAVHGLEEAARLDPNDPLTRQLLDQARGQAAADRRLEPSQAVRSFVQQGDAHRQRGAWEQAAACYREALQRQPQQPEVTANLGLVLQEQGRLREAAVAYQQALDVCPDLAEVHVRLGNLFQETVQADDAVASYQKALTLQPDDPFAHANLAQALANQGKLTEAARHFDASIRLRPNAKARIVKDLLLPPVYASLADLQARRQQLLANLARLHADGVRLDPTQEIVPNLFFLAYQGQNDRAVMRDFARLFLPPAAELTQPSRQRAAGDKIRVGFLSKHFCNHTIGTLNRGLVAQLDRRRFHVTVLAVGRDDDQTARQIREQADQHVELPAPLAAARQLVREQHLDVLYYTDLGMAPFTWSLAFARLAPVQCVTWGHPLTTGIPTIDYFLSSALLETADAETHYTEQLVRLQGLQTYYYRPAPEGTPKDRAHFNLPAAGHLYGCPQSLFKFHPEFDAILAGILRADPEGWLVLIEGQHPHWTDLLRQRWRRTMPDVLNRVRFLPKLPRDDFLHLNALFAVALDPLHFGGGNTSFEALALGVPVVTLPSPYLRGRITFAQYQQMGMLDCVAQDAQDYVARAVRLGTDPAYRRQVSQQILATCPVLFENIAGVRSLEDFLESVAVRCGG